jgi:ubiquinone/menaquinone biosynthesis C-methylase UbiE
MAAINYEYIGEELDVFALAVNWKQYWGTKIRPYLGQEVLEVGAGIGGTTRVLYVPGYQRWLALEPDSAMIKGLLGEQQAGNFPAAIEFRQGLVSDLGQDELFDSIIYIDVLEHIEKDTQELLNAARHLKKGGYLIVLSPAFQFLYTEFDKAIGHYRRYRKADMARISPKSLKPVRAFYLDALGMTASLGNLFFLHSPKPNPRQIRFWDRVLIPISRYLLDPLVFYSFGRSVIFIWQLEAGD